MYMNSRDVVVPDARASIDSFFFLIEYGYGCASLNMKGVERY